MDNLTPNNFMLRRDSPLAPYFVRIYIAIREGHWRAAHAVLTEIQSVELPEASQHTLDTANQLVGAIQRWQQRHPPNPEDDGPVDCLASPLEYAAIDFAEAEYRWDALSDECKAELLQKMVER